jgi:hypothetical protein
VRQPKRKEVKTIKEGVTLQYYSPCRKVLNIDLYQYSFIKCIFYDYKRLELHIPVCISVGISPKSGVRREATANGMFEFVARAKGGAVDVRYAVLEIHDLACH